MVKPKRKPVERRSPSGARRIDPPAPYGSNLTEPPGADPHAGWCGRGEWATTPPVPIFQIICARSEAVLERELDEARVADCRDDLCQRTWVLDVRGGWIGERRMVGHVEKIGPEQHALVFPDANGFSNRQVHVRLMWSDEAIARDVAETRRDAIRADYRRGHEVSGVHQVI